MPPDIWDPSRCNFEAPGVGFINAAKWNGEGRPAEFPSDKELSSKHASALKTHPKIGLLISHKGGMGDTVMCTTIARELRRRGVKNIWLETRWAEDFAGQVLFDGVLPQSYEMEWLAQELGARIIYPAYARAILEEDRELAAEGHILGEMCRQSGIRGEISLRPYFETDDEEDKEIPRDFIAISGLGVHAIRTKNWFADRFQSLAALLLKEFRLVQLGSAEEPLLSGAIDLRGKTDVRRAARILKRARCYVGEHGGLMHLARAVDCPSVVVFGGRETPRQSGYAENINLTGKVPCAPCWIIRNCPHDMECMRQIQPADVVAAVVRLLASVDVRPLEVEKIIVE